MQAFALLKESARSKGNRTRRDPVRAHKRNGKFSKTRVPIKPIDNKHCQASLGPALPALFALCEGKSLALISCSLRIQECIACSSKT